MWTWVDGHMVLVAILCWPVSYGLVGLENSRRDWRERRDARRADLRREVFAKRGAR